VNFWAELYSFVTYDNYEEQIQHVLLTLMKSWETEELWMTMQHVLWLNSANCLSIINLLSHLCYSAQQSQLTTYILLLLCEVSRLFWQNLLSLHRSEHFTSCQKQQKCLSHLRINLIKYRVMQQLYWNVIEHASSSWKLMKECADKTTDER